MLRRVSFSGLDARVLLITAVSTLIGAFGAIRASAAGPVTVLDTLNTSTRTTFSVSGSGGVSVLATQHAGPKFTLATRTQITEIGAFLNNDCGEFGNPPCALPFIVEIRPAVGGLPDPNNVVASFALSDDGDPLVVSYESVAPNLILDPGTYFALFAPQDPHDEGFIFGTASPNFFAGLAPLGTVDPGTSARAEGDAYMAVRILGVESPVPVPTLSEWAQIVMVSLFALVGLWGLRRRGA